MKTFNVTFSRLALLISLSSLICCSQKPQTHADYLVLKLRDAKSDYVFIAAHRGGYEHDWEYKAPENSLANIDKAVKFGFDVYETDLRISQDSIFVIMHDRIVDHSTNGTGNVYDLTLPQLKELKLKYHNGKMSDQTVPTFKEFLEKGKNRILFKVDFKLRIDFLPDAVKLVEENGMLDYVIFILSYTEERAEEISKMINSGMPFHPGLFMFRTKSVEEVKSVIDNFHPSIIEISLGKEGITPNVLESLQLAFDENILVETPTWQGPEQWELLINAGFRMIHTGEPEAMVEFLKDKKLR